MRGKVVNDPVYGFIHIPYGIVFELMCHPHLQRLRRVSQLGLTSYVYPGGVHTRFHHALGALHLMQLALTTLRNKGVDISTEEYDAACCAILLHDIGHGPFSHALEHTLLPVHHEALTLRFMQTINAEMGNRLAMCIQIFLGDYSKPFLHELVSGQLDVDRMDYLMRDSFFTGVVEGVIGYDRILKMMDVRDGRLVIEEKGIYSIERFLHARRLMYWQVYLHKTVLSAEHMLIRTLEVARKLARTGNKIEASAGLRYFLYEQYEEADSNAEVLEQYSYLDDTDVLGALKAWTKSENGTLRLLSKSLLDRRLFTLELRDSAVSETELLDLEASLVAHPDLKGLYLPDLILHGQESTRLYELGDQEIRILLKNGKVNPLSAFGELTLNTQIVNKYYLCYPKFL